MIDSIIDFITHLFDKTMIYSIISSAVCILIISKAFQSIINSFFLENYNNRHKNLEQELEIAEKLHRQNIIRIHNIKNRISQIKLAKKKEQKKFIQDRANLLQLYNIKVQQLEEKIKRDQIRELNSKMIDQQIDQLMKDLELQKYFNNIQKHI